MENTYDFSGWATRNNIKCSDGRTIRQDAFKGNDGETVPLVWNHSHNDAFNVLGHADLENRREGVYAYCYLNDTEQGQNAKKLIEHGDVNALSIYANGLRQQGGDVLHGAIKEVSLVLAGANPGAYIDSVIQHGEELEDEAIMYVGGEDGLHLEHADDKKEEDKQVADENTNKAPANNNSDSGSGKTVQDVIDSMTEEQQQVLYALVGMAANGELGGDEKASGSDSDESAQHSGFYDEYYEGDDTLKHNVFDENSEMAHNDTLSHSEMKAIIDDGHQYGTLSKAVLAHGIDQVDYLFPDAKTLENTPSFIKREDAWVSTVMSGAHHIPFSRVKSIHANLTEDDARAKGYIKGKQKKEEVFPLLKRSTTPTTIYKKQKMDRDDVIDITDFDVIAWLKTEMRMMLNEEIARAALVGDGRSAASDDKINEQNIRPIWTDDDLYTIKATIELASDATDDDKAKAFIRKAIKARKDYKGSGNPTLFTTEDMLTDCLLLEDKMGRVIYDSVNTLATAMRVSSIVTVPVMEGLTRTDSTDSKTHSLLGIIVNMNDYTMGADKGGEVNMFDDFDIDYNQQKYLIETRCSGALTTPYSAIALESVPATTSSGAKSNN